MTIKLIFWAEDTETGEVIGEKSELPIDLPEVDLAFTERREAPALETANQAAGGDNYANRVTFGRGKVIHDTMAAAGIAIGRYFERVLAKRFGSDHIELLDKSVAATKATEKT